MDNIKVLVDIKKYPVAALRYAAHAVSGGAYVMLSPAGGGKVAAVLRPKFPGGSAALRKRFLRELEDEKLRAAITGNNRELMAFIVRRVLSGAAPAGPDQPGGLSPAQEKELDALIAEVEKEIQAEGKTGLKPGVSMTWEEKYASAGHEKKKKR